MKKILAIILCVVFTWSACAFWLWADALAEFFNIGTFPFDGLAVVLLFAALCCSCLYNEERKNGKRATADR